MPGPPGLKYLVYARPAANSNQEIAADLATPNKEQHMSTSREQIDVKALLDEATAAERAAAERAAAIREQRANDVGWK